MGVGLRGGRAVSEARPRSLGKDHAKPRANAREYLAAEASGGGAGRVVPGAHGARGEQPEQLSQLDEHLVPAQSRRRLRPGLRVAYFSMEFGLTECLPIYSGGLGVLAGDHLKSASDLGVPLVGVGLLYQQGYFRQRLNADGWQQERYPKNDFYNLPVLPELGSNGEPVRISVEFPGRTVHA